MLTKRFYIQIFSALLLTTSCIKEDLDSSIKEIPGETASIVATLEPATKADIDGVDGSFTWSDGDKFGLWCATGTVAGVVGGVYDAATLQSGAGTDEAVFTVNLSGYRDRFAIFPWDDRVAANTGGGDGMPLYVNLPVKYTNLAHTPMPMVAENMAGEKVEFRHVGALLRLTLRNLPANVKHIKINTGENITGNFQVDTLSKLEPVISVGSASGSNGTTLTYSFTTALPTGGEVTLDVPLPTGLHYNLTAVFYQGNGNYNEFLGRVQRGDVRYFSRARGKAVTIDLPATQAALRTAMRVFSLNDPGNINVDKTVTMTYSATKGQNNNRDDYQDNIPVNDGLSINAWSLDPSIASVTVSEADGKPVIKVKGHREGHTTIMAMAKYGDDVMYAKREVTVILPTFTLSLSTHDQAIATGYSRTITAVCQVDGTPVEADYYEWEITESIGAADATITSFGGKAVITPGRQGGLVRYVCRATKGGITISTTPRQVQIVRHPNGTLPGSFTVSSDMSKEPVFFSTGNLLREETDEGFRYTFDHPQYVHYSGIFEAGNNSAPPTTNRCWDLFQRGIVDHFSDPASDGIVYVNEHFPETVGWFALNYSQWNYLLGTRKASTVCGTDNARYVNGRVGSVSGMILFPDDYVHPDERIILRTINTGSAYTTNILTKEEFALMEEAGAVFLPFTGDYTSSYNQSETRYVFYSTSSPGNTHALRLYSAGGRDEYNSSSNYYNPIRLVHY